MNATGKARVVSTDELGNLGADVAFVEACFNKHFDQVARRCQGHVGQLLLGSGQPFPEAVQLLGIVALVDLFQQQTADQTFGHAGAEATMLGQ